MPNPYHNYSWEMWETLALKGILDSFTRKLNRIERKCMKVPWVRVGRVKMPSTPLVLFFFFFCRASSWTFSFLEGSMHPIQLPALTKVFFSHTHKNFLFHLEQDSDGMECARNVLLLKTCLRSSFSFAFDSMWMCVVLVVQWWWGKLKGRKCRMKEIQWRI
jgi:hypothetical protein